VSRLAAALAATAALVLAWATPAGAHAELRETTPANAAVLEEPPERVSLTFSEPVEAGVGAVRVYDSDGERIDRGHVYRPDGRSDAVAVDLPALDRGTYVVTWRVVSADSHPVQGAFTFRLGTAPAGEEDTAALAERLLNAQGGSTTVGALYAVVRMLVFAALVVLVGGAAFVAALWPRQAGEAPGRRMLAIAWGAAVAATAAGIGLQGAYGAGLGLTEAVDPDVISAVLDTRFGRVWLARLGLLAVAAPLLISLGRRAAAGRRPGGPLLAALATVGAGLLLTPGLSGHASSGDLLGAAVAADLIHLAAVATWLGGLAVLTVSVLPRGDAAVLGQVVPRFSRVAFAAVVVIVTSGLFQSWRQLGSIAALTETTYGRLLTAKVVLVAAMIGLAALSRSWVRRRYHRPAAVSAGPGATVADDVGTLRRSVGAEAAVAVAVLAVTALLVNAIPGRTALALPYSTEVQAGDELLVDITVDPARAGPVELHFYTLTPAGLPAEVEGLTAQLRLPERDIGPLEVPLQRAGPNHFLALGFDVPIAGDWQLRLGVRVSEFEEVTARGEIPIR
jgi:copper transport protein